jgi:signal peptidase II
MTSVTSHLRLWIVAASGLALDLWSKDWAFRTFRPNETRTIINDLCSFQLSLNPGALFGLGEGAAPIFVGASVLALLFVIYLFAQSPASKWSMHIALGLVLAGAIGNLYDRTTQHAYVYYSPQGRLIGKCVSIDDTTVTIGDFPTGANALTRPKPTDEHSGPQPVVRDFVKIEAKIGSIHLWPWIFNVADALLVVGVGVLLIHFWGERGDHAMQAPAPDAQAV